jgi:hypothetical protein
VNLSGLIYALLALVLLLVVAAGLALSFGSFLAWFVDGLR